MVRVVEAEVAAAIVTTTSSTTARARGTASIIVNVICVSTAGALQLCGVS